jgi:hypothetical protein
MKLQTLALSALLLVGFAQAAEEPAPLLGDFATAYENQCHKDHAQRLKSLLAAGRKLTPEEKIRNDSLEQTKCQCMAGKIRAVSDAELARGLLGRDSRVASPFYEQAFAECVVTASRETVLPLCLLEAKKKPNSARAAQACKCMAEGYRRLDDQTLIDESRAVVKNSTERAKDPNVPLFHGKVAEIEDRCNKASGH